ncbi:MULTISPECIES: dynamin family protein [unclassified Exiguobacterium]|uniref:dynamin family protein n=1 Tax=unclassified Exiguobacterium TaxID=2644629 RepID=UPI001BE57299|nr:MULTISPECIES: dynamin family protein [unclassified Exiguobacterium]
MSKVYLEYNPFKLETIILIEGEAVRENSVLNVGNKRLQEWVDQLPIYLYEECNENEFELEFMGTSMDFEDVEEVVAKARQKDIRIHLTHIPVRELDHMEQRIEELFHEIVRGPIEELKTEDLKSTFEQALNDEFEITVVATMSAGKSTLINALLQQKIMPSSQEACTATISRIKDIDQSTFTAIPHPTFGEPLEAIENVSLEEMTRLNSDESISMIELHGDIPFTDAKETSLVLIDTPGPNNSRDENHLKMTYKNLSESSKTLVLYILNATQLGVDDDSKLLDMVAESMKVGGKQSKDRYLFVVNKLDQFRKGEDDVEVSLNKVRKYLANRGIHDPNIFPAAALPALDIRQLMNQADEVDEDLEFEISVMTRKLNHNQQLHLERYATLTPSVRNKMEQRLKEVEDGDMYNKDSALIHSGIPAIEETIKLYVDKYARTAKVKNIVDTFQQKLDSSLAFEKMKESIAKQTNQHAAIQSQIEALTEKIQHGNESKAFKKKIEAINPVLEIRKEGKRLLREQNQQIADVLAGKTTTKFEMQEAEAFAEELLATAQTSFTNLHAHLELVIEKHLNRAAFDLLQGYREKILRLMDGMEIAGIEFEPYELVQGDLEFNQHSIQQVVIKESVKVGEETYKNPEREGIIGFFKFFEPRVLVRDIYEEKQYIDGQSLTDLFMTDAEISTRKSINLICDEAGKTADQIKSSYDKKFEEVDRLLVKKLQELNRFTENAKDIESLLEASYQNLIWLNEMEAKIKSIIELESIKCEEEPSVDYTTI